MKHLTNLSHGRNKESLAHAKTDTAPGLNFFFLRRQARSHLATAAINLHKCLEGGLQVCHSTLALFL
jgi:hypothetical protein